MASSQPSHGKQYLLRNRAVGTDSGSEDSTTMSSMSTNATEEALKKLRTDLDGFAQQVLSKLDTVSSGILGIQQEIKTINSTLADLQTSVQDTADRVTEIEKVKLPNVEKEGKDAAKRLTDAITALEIHDRKQNLLFYGIPTTSTNKSQKKALTEVRSAISKLGFTPQQAEDILIVNAHRIPRKIRAEKARSDATPSTPDPIIVRFVTMFDRDSILQAYYEQQRKLPRDTKMPFTLRTDLPPKLKEKRYMLEISAYKLRKEQGRSTRIRLVGTDLLLESRTKGQKEAPWVKHVD